MAAPLSADCSDGTASSSGGAVNPKQLWEKLKGFSVDVKGAVYPLSARLSDEQDWSHRIHSARFGGIQALHVPGCSSRASRDAFPRRR